MATRTPPLARAVGAVASAVFGAAWVVWALASVVFLAIRILPGDAAALVLGDRASEPERLLLRHLLGLDRSLVAQYGTFVVDLIRLDLGQSLRHPGVSAFHLVWRALGPTSELASLAVVLGALLGIFAAVLSVGPWLGRRRIWVHRTAIGAGAVPLMALAPVATWLLAVRLRWVPLPGDPDAGFLGLLFASTLLAVPLGVQTARIGRAALLDLGRAQFLDVAAAKGAGPLRIWIVHALPVVTAPLAAVIATQLGGLLGGAVVLERLFERPGLGTVMLDAYAARDLPVLEASVVAAGLLFVVAQGATASIAALVDPRGSK